VHVLFCLHFFAVSVDDMQLHKQITIHYVYVQWRSQRGGGAGSPGPFETLWIFCHRSLEFQVSSIGAVQEDGFC